VYKRQEYKTPWAVVYSETVDRWVSNISTGSNFEVINGKYLWGDLFLVGKFANDIVSINKMYDSYSGTILGSIPSPSVTYFMNENPLIPKVFDVININSDPKLNTIDISTYNTYSTETQLAGMTIEDSNQREGTYRIQTLRDSSSRRLRGLYYKGILEWDTGNSNQELFSVSTQYRESERKI
jgi:hypothetical protein